MPIRRRILFGGIVVLACLAAMELTLQAAAWVISQSVSRGETAEGAGIVTILCIGDSHTYGLPLPPEDSYPAQLEAALAARHPERGFQVVNLGIPGLNSGYVLNRLEAQLFQLRPQLVMVWVGINNLWNVAERGTPELEEGVAGAWGSLRRALLKLRLYRLASIAWYSSTGHQYDPEERGGWYAGERSPSAHPLPGEWPGDPAPGLLADLERMAALTRAVDTPIVFVAYPMLGQRSINEVIEEAAGRVGAPLIVTRNDLLRANRKGHGAAELIDHRAGPHPSRLLYAYMVESMLLEVERTLDAWHGLGLRALPPSAGLGGHDGADEVIGLDHEQ
jgi:hypothetical protein